MLLTKILAGALSLAVGIIVTMVAAWANQSNHRMDVLDQRVATIEQHYAAIQTDLQDLRGHVAELKNLLRQQKEQ